MLSDSDPEVKSAIHSAIACCLESELADMYLTDRQMDIIEMYSFQYKQELMKQAAKEDGRIEGERRLSKLIEHLIEIGKNDEVTLAIRSAESRNKLYEKYQIKDYDEF